MKQDKKEHDCVNPRLTRPETKRTN